MISGQLTRRRSGNLRSAAMTGRSGRAGNHRSFTSSETVPATSAPTPTSFARFLWIFTALGLIVVVVVIGFLIGIVRALESIDDGLSTASNSVTGVTGNVEALPDYIRGINSALSNIDTALKPIPGQVANITDSLQSVRDSAGGTGASLKDTSQSLIDTSGSLEKTSTTLGPPHP